MAAFRKFEALPNGRIGYPYFIAALNAAVPVRCVDLLAKWMICAKQQKNYEIKMETCTKFDG